MNDVVWDIVEAKLSTLLSEVSSLFPSSVSSLTVARRNASRLSANGRIASGNTTSPIEPSSGRHARDPEWVDTLRASRVPNGTHAELRPSSGD